MNRAVSDVESSLSALKSSYAKTLSLAKVVGKRKTGRVVISKWSY